MPDKKPIQLQEVVVTAQRITPKKYREAKEKVSLYPSGGVDKYKIDSLKAKGHQLGEAIKQQGQPDMYGTSDSDRIKKLLRK